MFKHTLRALYRKLENETNYFSLYYKPAKAYNAYIFVHSYKSDQPMKCMESIRIRPIVGTHNIQKRPSFCVDCYTLKAYEMHHCSIVIFY